MKGFFGAIFLFASLLLLFQSCNAFTSDGIGGFFGIFILAALSFGAGFILLVLQVISKTIKNEPKNNNFNDAAYMTHTNDNGTQKVKTEEISNNYLNNFKIVDRFVVLDIETTGLSSYNDKIIEISLIKFEGENIADTYSTLINPSVRIPTNITQITGITDKMVQYSPHINDVINDAYKFIEGLPIIAHNANFDLSFLQRADKRWSDVDFIDTLVLSRCLLKEMPNHKLATLIEHFKLSDFQKHRSEADALATGKLYLILKSKIIEMNNNIKSSLVEEEQRVVDILKEVCCDIKHDTSMLRFKKSSSYITLSYYYDALRIKPTGRKTYLIFNLPEIYPTTLPVNIKTEPCSKSEKGICRIILTSLDDLYLLKSIIHAHIDVANQLFKYNEKYISNNHIKEYLFNEFNFY